MNLLVIIAIVAFIVWISRDPETKKDRPYRRDGRAHRDQKRIDALSNRVAVLEEVLLDRERRLRNKFRDL